MNKAKMDEVIMWLMDNPNENNGKAAYYLSIARLNNYG